MKWACIIISFFILNIKRFKSVYFVFFFRKTRLHFLLHFLQCSTSIMLILQLQCRLCTDAISICNHRTWMTGKRAGLKIHGLPVEIGERKIFLLQAELNFGGCFMGSNSQCGPSKFRWGHFLTDWPILSELISATECRLRISIQLPKLYKNKWVANSNFSILKVPPYYRRSCLFGILLHNLITRSIPLVIIKNATSWHLTIRSPIVNWETTRWSCNISSRNFNHTKEETRRLQDAMKNSTKIKNFNW